MIVKQQTSQDQISTMLNSTLDANIICNQRTRAHRSLNYVSRKEKLLVLEGEDTFPWYYDLEPCLLQTSIITLPFSKNYLHPIGHSICRTLICSVASWISISLQTSWNQAVLLLRRTSHTHTFTFTWRGQLALFIVKVGLKTRAT